jgi:CheY-like chemotaxis protein
MVFGFIKQSNGHIIIESLEGSGTCVCLYLPRYNGDQPDVHTQKDDNEHLPKGGGQSILIVEDELPVQEMLIKLVEYLGYTAIGVSSASEALQFLTRENAAAELIISDIVLSGGMNGLELGEEIAKRYPTVPVLYISGYAEDILRGKSVNDKEVDVLQKPFTVEKLADSIARRLSVS